MPQKRVSRVVLHDNQCSHSCRSPFVVLQRKTRNQSPDRFRRQTWVLHVRESTGTVIEKGPVNNRFLCCREPMEICISAYYRREHVVPKLWKSFVMGLAFSSLLFFTPWPSLYRPVQGRYKIF